MLTQFLERVGRKRIIFDRDERSPYLERYFLLFNERSHSRKFPFNIFLHHFCRSDADTFHDHPWNWASLVLKGGYWENTPDGRFWRGPGSFRFRRAEDVHFVELDKEKSKSETWTLFFVGRRFREWGFVANGVWTQWERYLNSRKVG